MKRNYPKDPYYTAAKFQSTCKCGSPIKPGDRIWYWPNERKAECEKCGEQSSRRFAADMFDETGGCY